MINFLIHPNLQNPKHSDYKKAWIYTWAMFVIGLFLIPYCLYFYIKYPQDTVKNLTNVIFGGLFLLGMLIGRYSSSMRNVILFTASIAYPPIMISVYHTGGIYSVDLIWFILCLVTQVIFLGYKWGVAGTVVVVSYFTYLFLSEQGLGASENIFKNYIIEHNSTHHYFTMLFVTILMMAVLGTFSRSLAIANAKVEELTKERIDSLESALLEKTKELSQIRQTLAKDFHDEMGNKLASISLLSQSVGLKVYDEADKEEISEILSTIDLRSKELYQGTKDFIWSIDLKSDYTDELFVYIRDFGESFFESLHISFYSNLKAEQSNPGRLRATVGRQLVYICKEIMTNAAKHAECSEVTLEMEVGENQLEVVLRDNGKGFDESTISKRGLKNISQRIEQVEGINMLKSNRSGTEHRMILPLEREILPFLDSTNSTALA